MSAYADRSAERPAPGAATSSEPAPWTDLEALAVEEAALVADGRIAQLAALYERRATSLAALSQPLPDEAIEPLRRALSMQQATATALQARRDAIGAELARLHRGRAGVQGYARAHDVRA